MSDRTTKKFFPDKKNLFSRTQKCLFELKLKCFSDKTQYFLDPKFNLPKKLQYTKKQIDNKQPQ